MSEPIVYEWRLIDAVIEQIRVDIEAQDFDALEELLGFLPEKYLRGFLDGYHPPVFKGESK